jgi:FAD binding domain
MARLSKVAAVGGGIGGLTAALALLSEGIDVDVYEQASEFQELGAGVQISSNGTCVLHAVGLQEAIERVASVPRAKEIGLCSTGPSLEAVRSRRGLRRALWISYVFMHRRDLHGMLVEGFRRLKLDALHLGMRCVSVARSETGVTLRFPYRRDCAGRAGDRCRRRSFDCAREPVRRCVTGRRRTRSDSIIRVWPMRRGRKPMPPASGSGADHGALRLALHLRRHGGSNLSRGRRAADGLVSSAQHQILDTDA